MSAWAGFRERLREPFVPKVSHLYIAAALFAGTFVVVLAVAVAGALYLRHLSQEEIARNARINRAQALSINNLRRLQRLEKPPTDAELARAAANALRGCVADEACRRALRGAIRRSKLRPQDVPSLQPRTSGNNGSSGADTPTGGGSSRGGGSNGGSPSSTGPSASTREPGTTPRPRRPPSPPRPPRPTTPAPTVSTAPPSPPATPATPSTPIPTPRPPTPSTPTVPPVTVPPIRPPIQVCTPVVQVNCRNPENGRVVGPDGHAADPGSNSGRGNQDDRLCERVKAPCDDDGNPVFPPGLLSLP